MLVNTDAVTLVYVLTDACNMRCLYCYEATANSLLTDKPCRNQTFTLENMLKAYDILSKQLGRAPDSVVFFGGEPFVQKGLIYDFIAGLKKRDAKPPGFAAITNAYLLDDELGRFAAENFSSITFSLDGAEAIHDKYRVDAAGGGTFERVAGNIRKFQSYNVHTDTAAEATLTDAYAQGDIGLLCAETWALFKSLAIPRLDYVPVQGEKYSLFKDYDADPDVPRRVVDTLVDLWFDDLVSLRLSTDVISFRNLLLSVIKKLAPNRCGAGQGYFAVTPDMYLYICQTALFVGDKPRWRLDEKEGVTEVNGGFRADRSMEKSLRFCRNCECRNGCTNYCRAQWEIHVPQRLPDVCLFHQLARARILERIRGLYGCGERDTFKRAVEKYYGKKS